MRSGVGHRWVRALLALVVLAGGCAWAWAHGVEDLPVDLLPVSRWAARLQSASATDRGWWLLPAGLLSMVFMARRTRRSEGF